MTAKTETGAKVFSHQKTWQEIGIDLKGNQQFKSWEIKNTIDQALQPRRTQTEMLTIAVPEGAKAVEIEATLTYHHRAGEEFVVHKASRKLSFR